MPGAAPAVVRNGTSGRQPASYAGGDHRAVIGTMEFEFIGGSMGAAVDDAAWLAELQQAPLIVFTASEGDRMQEIFLESFQHAEYLLQHGIIDMVVKRSDMNAMRPARSDCLSQTLKRWNR